MLFRGMLVGAASGKLGSLVASHNKGGQYMRARVVPSGAVPSPYQSVVRNALSSLAAAWSSELTADQRAAWEDYALNVPGTNRLGDSIQLSGINWFIGANTLRLIAETTRVDDAPTIFDRGSQTMIPEIAALDNAGGTLTFGGTVTGPLSMLLFQGRPFSSGRQKYYGSMRLAGVQDIPTNATRMIFTPTFSVPITSSQAAFDIVLSYDDGRYSTPFRVTFQG